MKKRTTILIAAVFVLLAAFFLYLAFFSESEDNKKRKHRGDRSVDAIVVKSSVLIDEISVSGSLAAYDEVELRNEVAGRVVSINLPEGKFVKKGTLLVKFFDDDLQAQLKKLQAQLALQQEILNRQTELYKVNGISKNDYEQTNITVNGLKADIEVQKTLIRKTEVLAPFDGVIGLRYISVGAILQTGTLLTTIRTEDRLKLDFFVPEKYSAEISTGMKVKFTMYNNSQPYTASVIATERGIDNATRNLRVRALVSSQNAELVPGAFATVKLGLDKKTDALMLPTQSIIPQDDKKMVIVARDGKAHFVEVKTGVRQAGGVEIISGIKVGDTVMTSGLLFLQEDSELNYASIR
ncbi:MAG: efflux RND transporter periplasmic adaptor subunit [Prevotellaceae bacterium]|jgi:membrane fusion protein (multidrug efflux system)|nr:efflux RND transporter periplasmic adaptor subunit [Prevotellaceae bacterium]